MASKHMFITKILVARKNFAGEPLRDQDRVSWSVESLAKKLS